jgi:hypothetical protein
LTRSGLKPTHTWVENANLYATDVVEIWLVTDDKVLVRQERENKMSTSFNLTRFQIVQKNDNSVLVESEQGEGTFLILTSLVLITQSSSVSIQIFWVYSISLGTCSSLKFSQVRLI